MDLVSPQKSPSAHTVNGGGLTEPCGAQALSSEDLESISELIFAVLKTKNCTAPISFKSLTVKLK